MGLWVFSIGYGNEQKDYLILKKESLDQEELFSGEKESFSLKKLNQKQTESTLNYYESSNRCITARIQLRTSLLE
jgi:hypothetical protein